MNYELITIIVTILLSWASLAWFIWTTHKDTHRDIIDLRERMAGLEGAMAGLDGKIGVLKDLFQAWLSNKTR